MDMLHDCPEGMTIDVVPWLTRATLDIIGLAGGLIIGLMRSSCDLIASIGFDYDFHSLEHEDKDELANAYTELFNSNVNLSLFIVMRGLICQFLGIVSRL